MLDKHCAHQMPTSLPFYWQRFYGTPGEIGHEATPEKHVHGLVDRFREAKRVLRPDGTLWVEIDDKYAGSGGANRAGGLASHDIGVAAKSLCGVPGYFAWCMRKDGWLLRMDNITWTHTVAGAAHDRVNRVHRYLYVFALNGDYNFDKDMGRSEYADWNESEFRGERRLKHPDGKAPTSIWHYRREQQPNPNLHSATMPHNIARKIIEMGCPPGGTVVDPFSGLATFGVQAILSGRNYIGIDANESFNAEAAKRLTRIAGVKWA